VTTATTKLAAIRSLLYSLSVAYNQYKLWRNLGRTKRPYWYLLP